MEFFEEAQKLGVSDIHITEDEWDKEYANSYNVIALNGSSFDLIMAAQDIIKTYLVIQAREKIITSHNTCPYCKGVGKEPLNKILVRCRFCGGSGSVK